MKALKILVVVAVAVMMMSSAAFAELNIVANVEINTDFVATSEEKSTADGSDTDLTVFSQGGRVEVKLDERTTMDNGMFAGLKGVFSIDDDGGFGSGDMYMELGSDTWEMRVGRPEAEGLFGKGQDILLVDAPGAPGRYEANAARGRDFIGGFLNIKPSDALMIQVGALYDDTDGYNVVGARPLVKFSANGLTVKAGLDYRMDTPKNSDSDEDDITRLGFGGNAEYAMGALVLGASAAMQNADVAGSDDESQTLSVMGYAKLAMASGTLGVGGGMTTQEFDDDPSDLSSIEGYVSYDAPLPVDGAAIKLAVAYEGATLENRAGLLDQDTSAFGGRIRLWYEF